MDFIKMTREIESAVGGSENIANVSHCATRLRLELKDNSKADEKAVEMIEGVKGVIITGSQYQIIIGDEVNDLYRTFTKEYTVTENGEVKKSVKDVFLSIGTYMQSCIGFMLMPMIGTGLIKAILTILSTLNVIDPSGATYNFIMGCCNAMMYFLPVLLAIGGAKRLGCDESMAAFIVLIPLCIYYVDALNSGTQLTLFGANVTMFTYSEQFIPAMLTTYIYAQIEKLLKKTLPSMLQTIVRPALSILIMIPITFLCVGPIMQLFNQLLALPTNFIVAHKTLFVPLIALIHPILVTFGLAGAGFGLYIATITAYGYDPIGMVGILCAQLAIGFVALAYSFISDNKSDKEVGISTGITMLFGAVSVPAIFGVLMKDKRMYLATECAGFVGGIVAALFGIKQYTFAPAYLLGLPVFVGPESSILGVSATVIVTALASFAFAFLFSRIIEKKA